jgi:drug/metabolite transporter (DMT)-like permease
VGVAAAAIVLSRLLCRLLPYENGYNWIIIGIAELWRLGILVLCGWAGQILRKIWPKPAKGLRIVLLVVAIVAVLLYAINCGNPHSGFYPHSGFFFAMMLACVILSYLCPFESVKRHDIAELIVMTVVLALLFAACFGVERHRWVQIPAALSFLYYIILLSREVAVKK